MKNRVCNDKITKYHKVNEYVYVKWLGNCIYNSTHIQFERTPKAIKHVIDFENKCIYKRTKETVDTLQNVWYHKSCCWGNAEKYSISDTLKNIY